MAVATTASKAQFNGSGTTGPFTFNFRFYNNSEITVIKTSSTGVDTTLAETTNYTLTGSNSYAGGSVSLLVALAVGELLTIYRTIPLTQPTDLRNQGAFFAETHEDAFDRLTMVTQQLQEQVDRSVKVGVTSDVTPDEYLADAEAAAAAAQAAQASAELAETNAEAAQAAAEAAASVLTDGDKGDITVSGSGSAWEINNDAVTFAKMQNMTTARLLGRTTASSGDVEEISVGAGLTLTAGSLTAQSSPSVRQTVYSGPVDSSGHAAFGGSTGGTTVTAAGTLKINAAGGDYALDRNSSIVNPSWTGLSTNGTMYLYLAIDSSGVVTTGSTTLAPTYQFGGTYSTTSGQHTFNVSEMTMKIGNGSAASQTWRVFVGQVTVSGGVTTAIVWYQLNRRYVSAATATLPSASAVVNFNHNIGVIPTAQRVMARCTTADLGFALGEVVRLVSSSSVGANQCIPHLPATATTSKLTIGDVGILFTRADNGSLANATLASWSYWLEAGTYW